MISKIFSWVIAALITALYVFSLVTAIGDIMGMVELSKLLNKPITGIGVLLLGLGVGLPVVAFALALWAGRRRSAWLRVLNLAAGFCLIAAIDLEVTHLVNLSSNFNENIFFGS